MRTPPIPDVHYAPDEQERLLDGGDDVALSSLARSSSLDPHVQTRLLDRLDAPVQAWMGYLARNPAADVVTQERILDLHSSTLDRQLGLNPALALTVQLELRERSAVTPALSRVLHRPVQLSFLRGVVTDRVLLSQAPDLLDDDVVEMLLCDESPLVAGGVVPWMEDQGLPVVSLERPASLHLLVADGQAKALEVVAGAGGDVEVARALLDGWGGLLSELVEASLLVRL